MRIPCDILKHPSGFRITSVLLALFFVCTAITAYASEEPDYFADPVLARTRVNIAPTQTRPTSLADILALIEKQTGLELIYLDRRIPLADRIIVESAPNVSLAHLLSSITTLTGTVFARHDQKIVVRVPVSPGRQTRESPEFLTDR